MKILQIHNYYATPGGECRVVNMEKQLLESHGHAVSQFIRRSKDIPGFGYVEKGLAFLQIPYNFQIGHALASYVKTSRPDVVHVHNVFPLLSPSVYSVLKRYNIPVVQTIHNYRFLCPNGLFFINGNICEDCRRWGYHSAVRKKCMQDNCAVSLAYAAAVGLAWKSRNLLKNIDLYLALNHFSANKFIAAGIPRKKIRLCGNFVETAFNETTRKKDYILYIGRLSAEKGLQTLLRAWMSNNTGISLKIAGCGPLESVLKTYADNHYLRNVEFLGHVSGETKTRLISEAICAVVPSEWYENFPIAVLESFACGTPVIASRIGGLPDMIENGKTGLLFTAGNKTELADCITRLATQSEEGQKMGQAALQQVHNNFCPEVHYDKLIKIYREAFVLNSAGGCNGVDQ